MESKITLIIPAHNEEENIESVVKEELEEIFNQQIDDVEKAIELLLYTMKKVFVDIFSPKFRTL